MKISFSQRKYIAFRTKHHKYVESQMAECALWALVSTVVLDSSDHFLYFSFSCQDFMNHSQSCMRRLVLLLALSITIK